jgi:aspartate/methionine/tyrosine aminotransferase
MTGASKIVAAMPRSGIREIYDLAHATPDCIHLETGEPDFPTPAHICDAAAEAARAGFTKYTPNAGIPDLREAIAEKVKTRNGVDVTADQVVVTPGGVMAGYSTIAALTDPDDGVLMADPSWPNFRMMAEIQSLEPQYFPTHAAEGFVPRAEHVEPRITGRSKILVLNSPSNPTGALIGAAELEELIELARNHDLWVLADEVYNDLVFGEPMVSAATFDSDGRVVVINSFSKSYSMTGWRVGYAVASPEVTSLITKCQEPNTSCANAPAQKAALAALVGSQDVLIEMRDAYRDRRDRALAILDAAEVPALRPDGAIYLWIDVSGSGSSDVDFAHRLIEEFHVAVVPGTAFGPSCIDHVRISLATAPDLLLAGVERLAAAVNEWAD